MKNSIIMPLPAYTQLAVALASQLRIEIGTIEVRNFPDDESYIRLDSDVKNKTVILVCGLEHPNNKSMPLMFAAQTIKELGAKSVCLITPYLPYMRQDKRFKPGEAITAVLFANYLSSWIDCLMTVDPHLHRIKNLEEIYSTSSIVVLHSTKKIAEWILTHVDSPFIIGPDEESLQWVAEVAALASAPYTVIKKTRYGDKKVSVAVPEIKDTGKTPVLVDDIISTGTTMLAAIQELVARGFKKPVCIGVHALFNNEAYNGLLHAGAQQIATCNTIAHPSNRIDITDVIVEGVKCLKLN
ncbi:ribose-phosphate pyrophosphokinase [Aquicella lusitana]|uniref:ribose-phosphate diphosphokinase n=1 Tax=Aquicella lusitana TaxID=254246 RepID=A0A370GJL3_9COXI|nr:ribose-phosphate pyrophosphokinase [Aquicella lusitana]RDI43426.1 ribose-phosphate pyrophosphokinase [Aquicella lusitana]VVC73576.1 Ribose-phosphate pyrophosphokinase [Aquicella lusitana]